MLLGCLDCRAIFEDPSFRYLDGGRREPYWYCPNCGAAAMELGEEPAVTSPQEGQFWLTDGKNMMGPYPCSDDAQLHLWAWFGGEHAKSESKQRNSTKESEDSGEG